MHTTHKLRLTPLVALHNASYSGFLIGCPSMTPTEQRMHLRLETFSPFTHTLAGDRSASSLAVSAVVGQAMVAPLIFNAMFEFQMI